MKSFERRIERLEKRFIPSREAVLRDQKLREQLVAGRERWRKYCELTGEGPTRK
jgi:hypothetical protein